jgi:hypothetical protein
MRLLSFLLFPLVALSAENPALEDPETKPPPISPVLSLPEGGIQKTEGSVQPWSPASPTELIGRYRLYGITDGHGWLDVKVTKVTAGEGEPWRVEGTLVTEWTKDDWGTLHFQGASLERDTELSYFEVGRRHFVGFFVEFTDKSEGKASAVQKAIVIGQDVFVRDDSYKPRSYRESASVPKTKKEKPRSKAVAR